MASLGAMVAGCSGDTINSIAGGNTGIGSLLGVSSSAEVPSEDVFLRARSPLVLPPDYNLRPPEAAKAEEARLGNQWPNDPDVLARNAKIARIKEKDAANQKRIGSVLGNERAMTPDEVAAGTVAPGSRPRKSGQAYHGGAARAMTPGQLRREARAQRGELTPEELKADAAKRARRAENLPPPPAPQKKKGFFDRLVFWD